MLRNLRGIFYFGVLIMAKSTTTKKKTLTSTDSSKEIPLIKYEDKSAGQPELVIIFNRLKALLLPYVKGSIKQYGGEKGQMHLVSHKAIEVNGKKRPEVYFISLLIQKGYVGFYFMPVYAFSGTKAALHPDFMKCLKGKACFHIKQNNDQLFEQIASAIQIGYDAYLQKGWLE